MEEAQRMERPTLKSILSKSKSRTYRSVEELDDSYYVMDGSNKRVTFDDEENNQNGEQTEMPLVAEVEDVSGGMENGEEDEEAEEKTVRTDCSKKNRCG